MKIHDSQASIEGWISVDESLPFPNTMVKVASISILDWNMETVLWESTGRLNKMGTWVIKSKEGINRSNAIVTHWKHI